MRFCLQMLNARVCSKSQLTEDNLGENIERKRTGDYQANPYMDSLNELLNEIEAQTLGFG